MNDIANQRKQGEGIKIGLSVFKFRLIGMSVNLAIQTLRIDLSMRYNALNGDLFPNKAVRTDVDGIYTHLIQPTEMAADWAGTDSIIPFQSSCALVGFHRGVCY
jgi:hypothetical protein